MRGITRHSPSTIIYVARITAVELDLRRRAPPQRQNAHAPARLSILHRFGKHLDGRYVVVEVTPSLLDDATAPGKRPRALRLRRRAQAACSLLEVNRIHQAAGSGSVILISADRDLNVAATAEGLLVENPNSHP